MSDVAQRARSLALVALGLEPTSPRLHFEFFNVGMRGELAASFQGTGAAGRTGVVQALRIFSGSGGGGVARLCGSTTSAATAPKPVPTGGAAKFWLGGYFQLGQATIAPGQLAGLCLTDLTTAPEQLCVGAYGSGSVVNFGVFGELNGFTDSGVPIDTGLHLHEFWRDGLSGSYRIDGITTIPSSARAAVDAIPCVAARAAAPAPANKLIDVRWFALAVEIP